ncbi:MAG: hypothetical protein QOG05_3617 [Streptosporangiaceae bacterium]|nr:hypothetical protein [Streptosporangiaceae bacterium]
MPGDGEEHVVKVGGVNRELLDIDRGTVEAAEQGAQPGEAPVTGHLQGEVFLVRIRIGEQMRGQVQRIGGGEPQQDMPAGDPALELGGSPGGDNPALVEDRDPVRELVGLVEVLGGKQDGDPPGGQLADDLPHGAPAARIQPGGGLVQENQTRAADQRHGQVEPAPHPPGIGGQRPSRRVSQVELFQQLRHPLPARGAGQMTQVRHQPQVLLAGEQIVHRGELPGHADRGPHCVRIGGHVVTGDGDLAGVGRDQGRQDPHHGGLAGPIRAQQGKNAALGHGEVDVVQDGLAAVGLTHSARPDCRGG